MAKKQIIEDNIWQQRIPAANRYYKNWERRFKCDILEDYYEGMQWKQQRNLGYNPYVINEVYDIIQIKIAQFVPTFLKYNISPEIANVDDFDAAANSAELKEHVLNTIIKNDDIEFSSELELAYRDAFFRFSIMEVGYAADWVMNPNAPKPLTKGNVDTETQASYKAKLKVQPQELPMNERIYVKHIPAKRFRVGGYDHRYLHRCGWVGYYEFIAKDDLLAMDGLMNKDKIPEMGTIHSAVQEPDMENDETEHQSHVKDTYKIWKIWDLRARVAIILLDDPMVTVFQRSFKRLPLFDHRPDKRQKTDGFYPIPAVYHWISPQDELNETREQMRAHRRRFNRKFQVNQNLIEDLEIEKFETGQDGALIKVMGDAAIQPIQDANLGTAIGESIMTSRDDMNRLSGTSNQVQGVVDRSTATEAQLINSRSQVRENKDRDRMMAYLGKIGREILLTARDRFVFGVWVSFATPEGENTFGAIQDKNPTIQYVSHEMLNDGYDFKVNVDAASVSTTAAEEDKKTFFEFLTVIQNFPMIAMSPVLVREAAYRVGYKNNKVIKEFQTMALAHQASVMQGIGMGGKGNQPQQIQAQNTPPQMSIIQKAMGQQTAPQGT